MASRAVRPAVGPTLTSDRLPGSGTLAGLAGALARRTRGRARRRQRHAPAACRPQRVLRGGAAATGPAGRADPPACTRWTDAPELVVESPALGPVRVLARVPYLQNLAALVLLGYRRGDHRGLRLQGGGCGHARSWRDTAAVLRHLLRGHEPADVRRPGHRPAASRSSGSGSASPPARRRWRWSVGGAGGLVFPGLQGAMIARGGESVLSRLALQDRLRDLLHAHSACRTSGPPSRSSTSASIGWATRSAPRSSPSCCACPWAIHRGRCSWPRWCARASRSSRRVGSIAATSRRSNRTSLNRALELDLGDVTDLTTRTAMLRTLRSRRPRRRSAATYGSAGSGTSRGSPLDDPEIQEILALRSRDADRGCVPCSEQEGLPATLVPHVIPLLAWDPVADDVVTALQGVAEERVGELLDALVDPNQPFAVRRRLARVFSVCVSQRAADGAPVGSRRPALRGPVPLRAIAGRDRREERGSLRIDGTACSRSSGARWPWAGPSGKATGCSTRSRQPVSPTGFVKRRAGQSLAHVFTLLSLVLPTVPLQIAYRGLQTDDAALRGTALEYLEGVLPRDIRDRLWPFLRRRPRSASGAARPASRCWRSCCSPTSRSCSICRNLRRRAAASSADGDT